MNFLTSTFPLFALVQINRKNVLKVVQAGEKCVVAVSDILLAEDTREAVFENSRNRGLIRSFKGGLPIASMGLSTIHPRFTSEMLAHSSIVLVLTLLQSSFDSKRSTTEFASVARIPLRMSQPPGATASINS